jgi:hypothetical protein
MYLTCFVAGKKIYGGVEQSDLVNFINSKTTQMSG